MVGDNLKHDNPTFPMAPGPVGGPAAWRGPEMAASDDWIYRLSDAEISELESAASTCEAAGLDTLSITKADFPLPAFGARLASLRQDLLHGRGFAYVRGLPVERYDMAMLARLYFGIGVHIGDPVAQNRNGHMVAHVIDIGTSPDDPKQRITQTPVELPFHSDSVDVVALMCRNSARSGGESSIVSAVSVHDEILKRRPDLLEVLYQPIHIDRRGEIPEGMDPWFQLPVFNWHEGLLSTFGPLRPYIDSAQRFDAVPNLTDLQLEALDLLDAVARDEDICLHLPFEKGDIQFLHNHLIMHGRTVYEDWLEAAKKRHLVRLWLSMPDGRPLPDQYRQRYVNIELGTRRGGIHVPGLKPVLPLQPETPAYH
ncbi:MAG: TauD/TfdA family dioxygenase [Rhodospirillaceae bacterium]|nr:TauD/TfdA family dioxygenase [Rhodospirillaceae bacterium]MBT5512691.1 TauD/TfdA family dioxygenase [Rhodospirillaceae bacterium]